MQTTTNDRFARYVGRFAPSPTGALHAGSLVAALASWLDARANRGRWLLRIEDLDPPREVPGAAAAIIDTLARLGLEWDGAVEFQSGNGERYRQAFERLRTLGLVYGCRCTRSAIEAVVAGRPEWPSGIYPGICASLQLADEAARAWRFRVADESISFVDRNAGLFSQNLAREVGDFVVRRADGLWAYQLAVVVDDDAQQITDVVRGADLLDNTPRQIALQRALGVPTPRYLHVAVVINERGEKLSKQTGATAIDLAQPLAELQRAAAHLGLAIDATTTVPALLDDAIAQWRLRYPRPAA